MKEFLPPIEREDIVELSHAIDDVIDSVEDVLVRIRELESEIGESLDALFRKEV